MSVFQTKKIKLKILLLNINFQKIIIRASRLASAGVLYRRAAICQFFKQCKMAPCSARPLHIFLKLVFHLYAAVLFLA